MFDKPPLVELIAELRWGAPAMVIPIGGPGGTAGTASPSMSVSSTRQEELFMRFGAKVANESYSRFERIVPPGFPLFPFQPVYRYRKSEPEVGAGVFQLGPGLFTANITPPYQSWDDFRPIVNKGVTLLLDCRDDAEKNEPFGRVSLRYIDAFGADFTGGQSAIDFLSEKLGFNIGLPKVIKKHTDQASPIRPTLQFMIPLSNDLVMNLAVAEGAISGQAAIIMDMMVSTNIPVAADVIAVMNGFDKAHGIIREIFVEMTQPIAHLMQPTDGGTS